MKNRITSAVLYLVFLVLLCLNLKTWLGTPLRMWLLGTIRVEDEPMDQRGEALAVQQPVTTETRPRPKPSRPKQRAERKFVYMMNTEQCLPDHLASSEAIGNATACDCEVIVLSYKRPCNDTSLRHVEYLYDPSPSVGSGRNMLYEAAMARDQRFLYYIIMDDDVQLEAKDKLKIPNPWRAFERSLLLYEPAVAGSTWTTNGKRGDDCLWCLKTIFSDKKHLGCKFSSSSDFIPVVHFDAAFSAFHRRAAAHILPYVTTFENISVIFRQKIVVMKAEIMFRGSVVAHTSVTALNTKHRETVPKGQPSPSQMLTLLEVAEKGLPEEYKRSSVAREWREHGINHTHMSSTLCLKPLKPLGNAG